MNLKWIQISCFNFKTKKSLDNKGLWICYFLGFTRPWWPSNVFGDRNVHLEDFDGLYGLIFRLFFISKYEAMSLSYLAFQYSAY